MYADSSTEIKPDSTVYVHMERTSFSFSDIVSVINILLMLKDYDLAFAYGIAPNFKNLSDLAKLSMIYSNLLRSMELKIIYNIGPKHGFNEPFIVIDSISIGPIDVNDEYKYDRLISHIFDQNTYKKSRLSSAKQSPKNPVKTYSIILDYKCIN